MLDKNFRKKVQTAILEDRKNFEVSDAKYASSIGLSKSVYSRLKNGETERIASDSFWIEQGRRLSVGLNNNELKIAKTHVYTEIEYNIHFCKNNKKAVIIIDEPGVGKTRCAKHVLKSIKNGYYIDCSQATTKSQFIKYLAKTLGLASEGKLYEIKENIKYFINLTEPVIVLDDAGYLESNVLVEIIGIWNGTSGKCGWIMMGDDSLQTKIKRGIDRQKVGFTALFSRFSGEYISFIPKGAVDRQNYLGQLIGDVADANVTNKSKINKMIKTCLAKNQTLRQLDTLIALDK